MKETEKEKAIRYINEGKIRCVDLIETDQGKLFCSILIELPKIENKS